MGDAWGGEMLWRLTLGVAVMMKIGGSARDKGLLKRETHGAEQCPGGATLGIGTMLGTRGCSSWETHRMERSPGCVGLQRCSGQEDAPEQDAQDQGDAQDGPGPGKGRPARTTLAAKAMPWWGDGEDGHQPPPPPAPLPLVGSLKRAGEEKEQRLALLAGGQAAAARETERLRGALRQLEHDRLEARRELQELRRQVRRGRRGDPRPGWDSAGCACPCVPCVRSSVCLEPPPPAPHRFLGQVKALDSENSKKSRELEELQARMALEEQREEESRREAFGLRRKVVESEAGMEATRKEVGAARSRRVPRCPHRPHAHPVSLWVPLLLRRLVPWVPPSPPHSVPDVPIALLLCPQGSPPLLAPSPASQSPRIICHLHPWASPMPHCSIPEGPPAPHCSVPLHP